MPFQYKNKKGEIWYLHMKVGRGGNLIFYFSKDPIDALEAIPPGYIIVETRNGVPMLKKLR